MCLRSSNLTDYELKINWSTNYAFALSMPKLSRSSEEQLNKLRLCTARSYKKRGL